MAVREGDYVGGWGYVRGVRRGLCGGYVCGGGGGYVGEGGWIRWGGGGGRELHTLGGGSGMLGGGGTLGRSGVVVVDVRSWSKMLFLGTFWKITTYWPPLDERVRSSFA